MRQQERSAGPPVSSNDKALLFSPSHRSPIQGGQSATILQIYYHRVLPSQPPRGRNGDCGQFPKYKEICFFSQQSHGQQLSHMGTTIQHERLGNVVLARVQEGELW